MPIPNKFDSLNLSNQKPINSDKPRQPFQFDENYQGMKILFIFFNIFIGFHFSEFTIKNKLFVV